MLSFDKALAKPTEYINLPRATDPISHAEQNSKMKNEEATLETLANDNVLRSEARHLRISSQNTK